MHSRKVLRMGVILRLIFNLGILLAAAGFIICVFRIARKKRQSSIYLWQDENTDNRKDYDESGKINYEQGAYDASKDFVRYRTLTRVSEIDVQMSKLADKNDFKEEKKAAEPSSGVEKKKKLSLFSKIMIVLCLLTAVIIFLGMIFGIRAVLFRFFFLTWRICLYIGIPVCIVPAICNLKNKKKFVHYIKLCLVNFVISIIAWLILYNLIDIFYFY